MSGIVLSSAVRSNLITLQNTADLHASLDAALRDVVERNITVDPRTRELVFQTVSKETGEVVRQIPDEAILRLRAYIREMVEAEEHGRDGVRRVEKIA